MPGLPTRAGCGTGRHKPSSARSSAADSWHSSGHTERRRTGESTLTGPMRSSAISTKACGSETRRETARRRGPGSPRASRWGRDRVSQPARCLGGPSSPRAISRTPHDVAGLSITQRKTSNALSTGSRSRGRSADDRSMNNLALRRSTSCRIVASRILAAGTRPAGMGHRPQCELAGAWFTFQQSPGRGAAMRRQVAALCGTAPSVRRA